VWPEGRNVAPATRRNLVPPCAVKPSRIPSAERESSYAARHAWQAGPHGVGPRLGMHGNVGVLRRPQRHRVDRHDSSGARPGNHVPRHGGHVRPVHQRAARRPRHRGPARAGDPGDEVRKRARSRRQLPRSERPAGVCARSLRRVAQAARRGHDRSVLPAPRRPQRADRGDRGRHGRAGAGREGAVPRALRGVARDRAACPPGAPDQRTPDRVFPVESRPRSRHPADVPGAGDRLRGLQPARAGVSHRPISQN